ncbi:MAG: DUF6754 domain-containing protein [Candidatus Brocadiia bacterium]
MRKLVTLITVLALLAALYGTGYAEEPGAKAGKTPEFFTNGGFETLATPVAEGKLFPFGWNLFLAEGASASLNIRQDGGPDKRGILLQGTNKTPIFADFVYVEFPSSETVRDLKGMTIVLKARVKVLAASGKLKAGADVQALSGLKTLVQGQDFSAANEMLNYADYVSVNILFSKFPTKDKKVDVTGLIAAEAKSKSVAFSPTDDYVDMVCTATVPDCNSIALALEMKGDAKAVFEDISVEVPANAGPNVVLPMNLSLSALIPSRPEIPKDWFPMLRSARSYVRKSSEYFSEGQSSLEIGNGDALNTGENIAFTANFDIKSNTALWGKEVTFSAKVRRSMAPGITPKSDFFNGVLAMTDGKEYVGSRELIEYSNYASLRIQFRKTGGKLLEVALDTRTFAFGTSDEWVTVSAKAIVPPRCLSIEWQALTKGFGRAWFDDASVTVSDPGQTAFVLPNLGFEKGWLPAPDGWGRQAKTASAILAAEDGQDLFTEGKYSLCIANPNFAQMTTVSAVINVPMPAAIAGTKLTFKAYVKCDFTKNDFRQMANIALVPRAGVPGSIDIATADGLPKSISLSGKTEWVPITAQMVLHDYVGMVVGGMPGSLQISLNMTGVGKVYFDDVTLTYERLSYAQTSLSNPDLNPGEGKPDGWDLTGVPAGGRDEYINADNSPVYGEIYASGARIWQDIDLTKEQLAALAGHPVTVKALVRCEAPLSAAVGLEFFGSDKTKPLFTGAGSNVPGYDPDKYLLGPFRLSKLTSDVPVGCEKIRAFLQFSGADSGRYQARAMSVMGADPAKDPSSLDLPADANIVDREVADFFSTPTVDDSLKLSNGRLGDYSATYGVVSKVELPNPSIKNTDFTSQDRYVPSDYHFLRCYGKAMDSEGQLFAYHVIPADGNPVELSQLMLVPEEYTTPITGRNFTFYVGGFCAGGAKAVAGVRFLNKEGADIGGATSPLRVSDKLTSADFYRPEKASVSAVVPENTASIRVYVKTEGTGTLLLNNCSMSPIFFDVGFFDFLAYRMYFDFARFNVLVGLAIFGFLIVFFIYTARRRDLFIRKIAGLDSIDEAVGRATEMGKPILYCPGMDSIDYISTIAAVNIIGRVAKKIAEYETPLLVPCRDPIVMTVCQETVKSAYMDAGRPDAYREESVYFVTSDQFAYVSSVSGTMNREKPAANFYMGGYYAESLILAETGALTGAIQVAGTDSVHQLPFFIVACDYTLMGEELYAASAYLSREPMQLGSLKGSDYSKVLLLSMVVLGTVIVSLNISSLRWLIELINVP